MLKLVASDLYLESSRLKPVTTYKSLWQYHCLLKCLNGIYNHWFLQLQRDYFFMWISIYVLPWLFESRTLKNDHSKVNHREKKGVLVLIR